MSDSAISVKSVSKDFYLPSEKSSKSLKSAIVNFGKKKNKDTSLQHALIDISFEIKKGEFFGIVGRNGSGKSTLLKILAGIYQPTKGSIHTQGKLVPFIELGVGFNPELSGRENVYLNGALLGFSRKKIDAIYNEIVEFAELDGFMDQKLKNYSSGMQVRLAFSVATRADADILLVDEVLAVGDADFQRKCFNYFRQLKKHNKTVVFVSHDMNAVRDYCDRALLIEKSRIVKYGNVAEIASTYAKLFIHDENDDSNKLDQKRWGSKDIQFTNINVDVTDPDKNDSTITVKAKFTVNKDVTSPLFGITIKNMAGTEMCGINNKLLHVPSKDYKKGQSGSVTWSFPNILNDADYTTTITSIDGETLSEFDWWEDAVSFSVHRVEHTAYVVEPPFKMSFSD